MENASPENQLLKNKYDLHKQPEVEAAAKRHLAKTGEKISQDPMARIQNYLDRFREITNRTDPDDREHGIDAAKRWLYQRYVIKPGEVPESYFENQKRLAREQGQGDIDIPPEARKQLTEVIIADQRSSLDLWVDYLSSPDAPYSDGLKYWTLRSVLSMGEYDKEKQAFTQRSKSTVKPFPDLDREALAYVLDAVSKKYKGYDIDLSKLEEQDRPQFEKLLASENFPRLYAWAIEKITPATPEELTASGGKWVKYDQGSDHIPLVKSLEGHGTGWCTAGESTAEAQLKGGDFYVYYSTDKGGNPTVPRIAIRMEQGRIAEVRGIAPNQNLDPGVTKIVEDKLKEFPDGELYKKKVHDMKLLTEIENKTKNVHSLTAQELRFLYEIDSPIDGFGYNRDPRIEEIQDRRKPDQDILVIFDCVPSQIAHNASEINETTKAYVGRLEPGIFTTLQRFGIEHIYTEFLKDRIRIQNLEIGGKNGKELEKQMKAEGIEISSWAQNVLGSIFFTALPSPQNLNLVRIKTSSLGLSGFGYPTTNEVCTKAKELGLELCPAEVGPHLRLKYHEQPSGEYLTILVERIPGWKQDLDVFTLGRDGGNLWLRGASSVFTSSLKNELVFSLPK